LRATLGISLLFRVKLCLDGVPRHVWNVDIMERIVGVRCALEDIETNLQRPKETKTIDVWAWTANPCLISKRVWLVFTSKVRDAKLSSMQVRETPPKHWQQGCKYPIILHLEEIHDYTIATMDEQGDISLAKRRLPQWHLGVLDGAPVPTPAVEPLPDSHWDWDRGDRQPNHGRRHDGMGGRSRRYYDDHPDFACDHGWRHHDDDEDNDKHGRDGRVGRDGRRGQDKGVSTSAVRHERERSPRCRNWGQSSGRHHAA
jgi:hypothetical protein